MNWKDLNPPTDHFKFKANDPSDIRISDLIQSSKDKLINLQKNSAVLLSYPDDEGISLNGGRPGSSQAGESIRKYFYKMTWPFLEKPSEPWLYDLGFLKTSAELKDRHESARKIVKELLLEHQIYTIGGGHDYGFSDGAAFIEAFSGEFGQPLHNSEINAPPLIINLDAHLDVRPTTWGLNSGTPFYRLLTQYKTKFQFIEIGLQKQCNSAIYWQWAKDQGATLISNEEIRKIGILPLLKSILQGSSKKQKCFISLDIDVFAQFLASGCSQSWGSGLNYADVIEVIGWLVENKDVKLFSIYEVSPPLDNDNSTSKLAAGLLFDVMIKNKPKGVI